MQPLHKGESLSCNAAKSDPECFPEARREQNTRAESFPKGRISLSFVRYLPLEVEKEVGKGWRTL